MADEALEYQEEPAGGSVYQPGDEEISGALRRQKHGSRVAQTTGTVEEVGGRMGQAGGLIMQGGGKTMEVASRGGQAVSRGVQRAGERVTPMGYGAGAIVGVPLTGLGTLGQATFKGTEELGKGLEKEGRVVRQKSGRVAQRGKQIRQHADRAPGTGSFLPGRQRRQEEQDNRSLLGAVITAPGTDPRFQRAVSKITHAIGAPIRPFTTWALKASWTNLIDSFGLTLIYIHAHLLGRLALGTDFFCKLGREWSVSDIAGVKGASFGSISGGATKSASSVGTGGGNPSFAKFSATMDRNFGKAAGVVEALLLMAIDLIILFILIGALLLISYLVAIVIKGPAEFLQDPINFTKELMTKGL